MCAWLRTTASSDFGSNGKLRLRSMDSSRLPWNRPHSNRSLCPLTSSKNMEPVVVRVATKKWICIGQGGNRNAECRVPGDGPGRFRLRRRREVFAHVGGRDFGRGGFKIGAQTAPPALQT